MCVLFSSSIIYSIYYINLCVLISIPPPFHRNISRLNIDHTPLQDHKFQLIRVTRQPSNIHYLSPGTCHLTTIKPNSLLSFIHRSSHTHVSISISVVHYSFEAISGTFLFPFLIFFLLRTTFHNCFNESEVSERPD